MQVCQTWNISAAELELRYVPDDKFVGRLYAKVTSGRFSGEGSAWFDRGEVVSFIEALRAYPLPETGFPMIEGGFWNQDGSGTLAQRHLHVAVRPYDRRGTLLVQVELATECWKTPGEDQQQAVVVRFTAEYAALPDFARELELVLDGSRQMATLDGICHDSPWA